MSYKDNGKLGKQDDLYCTILFTFIYTELVVDFSKKGVLICEI